MKFFSKKVSGTKLKKNIKKNQIFYVKRFKIKRFRWQTLRCNLCRGSRGTYNITITSTYLIKTYNKELWKFEIVYVQKVGESENDKAAAPRRNFLALYVTSKLSSWKLEKSQILAPVKGVFEFNITGIEVRFSNVRYFWDVFQT